MAARHDTHDERIVLALNLDLSRGRHGASARIEIRERPTGRIALLALRGWMDRVAVSRLDRTLDDLAARGVEQLLLDCSQLRHIDYRMVPALVESLARFESRAGGFVVCGLSHYLRDLFRLAGCEPRLRCWPSAAELLGAPPLVGTGRECAS
ncbi:MAG: STAS domain-containing protein [Candidatus Eisenbacteria bacterium]|nr:STAS domain-containing protein [Candidatus Eisenbacteria bacterium]